MVDVNPNTSIITLFIYLFIYFGHAMVCGTLVPRPGIEPVPPAVEAQSLNNWAEITQSG